VIGYHIKNPYHFSFQKYYMKCAFGVHPFLNAPEEMKDKGEREGGGEDSTGMKVNH